MKGYNATKEWLNLSFNLSRALKRSYQQSFFYKSFLKCNPCSLLKVSTTNDEDKRIKPIHSTVQSV